MTDDTIGYVRTGEQPRPPTSGEYYHVGEYGVYRGNDYAPTSVPRHIMRPIPRGSVVLPPEVVSAFAEAHRGRQYASSSLTAVIATVISQLAAQAPPKPPRCPAPGCGAEMFLFVRPKECGGGFRLYCSADRCGTNGPWRPTEAEAREAVEQMGGGK
jgi:hypothetical protein